MFAIEPESSLREGITLDRLDARRTLLDQLDDRLRRVPSAGLVGHDRMTQQAFSVLTIEVAQEQIQAIRVMANPEKLTRV